MRILLVMIMMASAMPNAASGQRRDTARATASPSVTTASPACCSVVRIEQDKSLVTARETATGFTFRFTVKNRRLLATLKIGNPVWADFGAKTVRLNASDSTSCCAIVETPPPSDSGTLGVPQENQ